MKYAFSILLLILPLALQGVELRQFDHPQKQQRYENLLQELRCLVCQNQSLADSDADLAQDLRDEVYRMIQSGKSDSQVIDFLVERYGDFVLYRPPLKANTYLLWSGPFVLLLIGLLVLWRQLVKRKNLAPIELSPEERQRLKRLIDDEGDES